MNDGKKKKPQKHQNKQAFKIVFDTLALQHQKKVSLSLLCKRCSDQISWKLQFNKYKKITQPSKCNYCHNKNVVRSYMRACDPCAQKQRVCPKCLSKDGEILQGDQVKLSAKQQALKDKQEQKAMNDYIDLLRQRSKRKVKRQYQKGLIQWDQEHKLFKDMQGNQVVGLKFKTKGLGDLEKQMQEEYDNQDQSLQGSQANQNSDDEEKILQLKEKGKASKNNLKKEEQESQINQKQSKEQNSEILAKNNKKDQQNNENEQGQQMKGSDSQRQSSDGQYCEEDQLNQERRPNDLQEP